MSNNLRQGSLHIVNVSRIRKRGALSISEGRIRVMIKWFWSNLAAAALSPTLYLLSIGIGVGKLINTHSGGVDGVKYLTFLAPALLATAAIQNAMDEAVFPTLDGFKWSKSFFAMNATPISSSQIADGILIAALVRTFFSVTIYGCTIYFFGGFSSLRGWLAIPTALFAGAAFGAFILGIAAATNNDDSFFMILGRFVMMPLFLFSGTFYQLATMPFYLRWIGWISPLWHATELSRYFTYGHRLSGVMVLVHAGFLIAMFIFGLHNARKQFTKRLSK
jgi:lipooligosaccharide transport system permease protein